MNHAPSRVLPAITFTAALLGLLLAAAPRALASAEEHVNDGIAVSQAWVTTIDGGLYDQSYSEASGALHDKVAQDRWDTILKALRTPWGQVVSRQPLSHEYKPNGFEGAEGEFLIITYDSSFKKANAIKEVVVLRWEDGRWRGAGYNAGPKGNPDDGTTDLVPSSTTEMETHENVKPEPQK